VLLLDELEGGTGLERAHRHQRGAEMRSLEQRRDESADPKEGHRREHDVVTAHGIARLDVVGVPNDRTVGVNGSLRVGGASGAVDDHRRVCRRHAALGLDQEIVVDAGAVAAID